jgi:soluble lytic murein transglycosylase-like protein
MRSWSKFGLLLALLATSRFLSAGDIAILRNGFTIPHEKRVALGTVTRLYTSLTNNSYVDIPTEQIDHYEKDLSPAPPPAALANSPAPPVAASPAVSVPAARVALPPQKLPPVTAQNLNDAVNEASDKHMLDADLINSVIRAESGFNPRAVSPKGARGLMQLMPQTAANLGVPNAFDPKSNVDGGTRYLRWLLERYNYDLVKALAAYNAGPQRVEQYRGVPPYSETRAYVARIIRDFNRKKLAEQKAEAAAGRAAKGSRAPAAARSVATHQPAASGAQ